MLAEQQAGVAAERTEKNTNVGKEAGSRIKFDHHGFVFLSDWPEL